MQSHGDGTFSSSFKQIIVPLFNFLVIKLRAKLGRQHLNLSAKDGFDKSRRNFHL